MTRSWLFGIPLLVVLSTSCVSMRGVNPVNRAFGEEVGEGVKLVQTGHYRQAIDELTMLLAMDPKNEEARITRAMAYQALEEFPLAIEDYEILLKQNPNSAKAHYNLGMIYAFKLNEPKRASEHFDRFLSIELNHPKAFSAAKIMSAIDESEREAGPSHPDLPPALEEVKGIPNLEERKERILDLARQNPGSPLPYYFLGKTYEYEGEEEEAIRSYRKALAIRPTSAPCHQVLGRLLLKKKKTAKEGSIHIEKAKLFDPNNNAE